MPRSRTILHNSTVAGSGSISQYHYYWYATTHTHTHTRLTALCLGLPRSAGTRKVKPIWILLKQETVSGSGISWAVCKSVPRSRQITTPAPHNSVIYRPDALHAAQPTLSKHWRHNIYNYNCYNLGLQYTVYQKISLLCFAKLLYSEKHQVNSKDTLFSHFNQLLVLLNSLVKQFFARLCLILHCCLLTTHPYLMLRCDSLNLLVNGVHFWAREVITQEKDVSFALQQLTCAET